MWAWSALPILQEVIVNLTDGTALRGVLRSHRWSWYTLSKVSLYETPPKPIDGDVLVHRSQILFIQIVPPSLPILPPSSLVER